MSLLLFLNELSELPLADDIRAARARMERFIEMLRRVQASMASGHPTLRLRRPIHEVELSREYPIARWMNDSNVPKEHRQWLMLLATSAPLFPRPGEVTPTVNVNDREDCFHDGREAFAFSAARLMDGLPISFASTPCWECAWVTVTTHRMDAEANLLAMTEDVRHASDAQHVDEHAPWIHALTRIPVRDGRDLWDKRSELFPALEFCAEVRAQLAAFRSGDPALRQIIKRLTEMQTFFANWQGLPIGPHSLPTKCTPESSETLKLFADAHTFTRPNRERMVFSWHVRFTPDPGRIFFDGDPTTRKGLVGCVARNGLPTVRDPT